MHIGVHILHTTLSTYQVFGTIAGDKFSVDIDNKTIRYYSGIFVFILFYKCWSFGLSVLCVIAVKVKVSACEHGVRLNYIRLILNRKEPYTEYAEN